MSYKNSNRVELVRLAPLMMAISALACGPKNVTPEVHPNINKSPVIVQNSDGWFVEKLGSTGGGISIEKARMPADQIRQLEAQLRQTNLVAIPIDPKYNASLFKIRNVPEWQDTIFIAPKLFAYGSAERGRIAPKLNPDGTASLSFPVLLTDGTEPTIVGADATTQVMIPDTLRVNDLAGLRAELFHRFEKAQNLAVLPGCPKKIIVKVNDAEYDATPSDLARGDFCQLNAPFSADLKLPLEQARYLLQHALYANAVDVRAVYETRVAYAVSRVTIKFDKSRLFEDLKTELSAGDGLFADAEAQAKLTKVVKTQAMKVNIQGQSSTAVDSIISQAVSEFFERIPPTTTTETRSCGGSLTCVRLNYNYSRQQQSFEASWDESTNTLSGQNYITWTKLKPLSDRVVDIGNSSTRPTLKNGGAMMETGLTAIDGDLLEVMPSYLVQEYRENIPSGQSQTNDWKCWVDCSKGYNCPAGVKWAPTSCDRPTDSSLRRENHWIKTTKYDLSRSRTRRFDQPVGQLQQIFDGLALKFTWKENGIEKSSTCSLNSFVRDGDGRRILVRLENRPGCEPFQPSADGAPMVHLVNNINFPVSVGIGTTVESWDGRFEDHRVFQTYLPRVEFAGTIAIRGYDLGSSSSFGRLERR